MDCPDYQPGFQAGGGILEVVLRVEILDPVHCRILEGKELLKPLLSFKSVFWKKGRFGRRERKEWMKSVIDKDLFSTGLLPKVRAYCDREGVPLTIEGREEKLSFSPPSLEGIEFRPDQLRAVKQACEAQRGVIVYPTRTGKSILIMGIVSAFPKRKFLLLAHTLVIVSQLQEDVDRFGLSKRVDVGTVQTWSRKDPQEFCDQYDGIIIDEAHHITQSDGHYTRVIHNMLAPVRLGFTATPPPGKEEQLVLEGTLGPVVADLSITDAVEMGVLAKPKVRLVRVPYSEKLRKIRSYSDAYSEGIVHNRARNRLVVKEALELVEKGFSVLIMITNIAHGEELVALADRLYGVGLIFVQGSTENEVRTGIRAAMKDKSVKIVIATAVFREGINIPSLNAVINAGGGKSETMTKQISGRPLTVTEGKSEGIIVDFLDLSNNYLTRHTGERIGFYSDMGWI
jgi:superfamily II DNA or RNA helicase